MRNQSLHQLKFQALLAERAHCFRHSPTETEAILWRRICGKQLGTDFKRQVPIGRYIADFLAPGAKLIVEVDGGIHSRLRSRDARRDRDLGRLGYRVVRVPAELVRHKVVEAMHKTLHPASAGGPGLSRRVEGLSRFRV